MVIFGDMILKLNYYTMKVSFYDIKGEVKMSENELKSCPFCGGKAEIFYWQGYINDECHSNLTCTTCGAGFHDILSEEDAFKAWNRRINNGEYINREAVIDIINDLNLFKSYDEYSVVFDAIDNLPTI